MGWAVAILLAVLRDLRRRTYTREQLDAIKREVAKREGGPLKIEGKPYRWWKFYWS